jgi:hypothetical protein
LTAALGCQGSTAPTNQAVTEEKTENAEGGTPTGEAPVSKPPFPILEGVESFEGTWLLAPAIEGASRAFWLFRLDPSEDGGWKLTDVANEALLGKISGKKVVIDGNSIRIDAELDNPNSQLKHADLDFEGTLDQGVVWGNLQIGQNPLPMPARLFATDADTLTDYAGDIPDPGHSDFQKASTEPDPAHTMWNVARQHPQSPLSTETYRMLFARMTQWKLTDDEVRAMADDYRQSARLWGPRLEANAEINAGLALASSRIHIDIAEELFNDAEKAMPQPTELMQAKLKGGRTNLRLARGLAAIRGDNAAAAAAAEADLKTVLENQPYHPELLYALADYAAQHQRVDEAIRDYKLLVALPGMESIAVGSRLGTPEPDQMPHAALQRLWKEKHGSLDGLEAALAETYEQETAAILDGIRQKAPKLPKDEAGNKLILMELFTGTACGPCVTADLVLHALTQELPAQTVLVSYHQHIPGADPLASGDAEGRAKYYNVEGTPSLFINGQQMPQIGYPFLPTFVEQCYRQLLAPADFFLKQSTDVQIEASAHAADRKLNVNVAAHNVPEEMIKNVRLRIALVEDEIDFLAPNGLRHHRMVVRTMLGGTGGKRATADGKLELQLAMPLDILKVQQIVYLAQYEHGKRIQFPVKPLALKPLHLVAFVQNDDQTHEVLQSAIIPVTGDLE